MAQDTFAAGPTQAGAARTASPHRVRAAALLEALLRLNADDVAAVRRAGRSRRRPLRQDGPTLDLGVPPSDQPERAATPAVEVLEVP